MSRALLVDRVVRDWVSELIDLGGRNNLINYRDLKAGTLSLDDAEPAAMEALIKGRSVSLARLFPTEEGRKDAVRRARTIHRKARENFEERGIDTLHVACGIATWTHDRPWAPAAPVLLIPAELSPMGAAMDDFRLTASAEPELNPTLLHLLKVEYRCEIDPDGVMDVVDGPIDEAWEVVAVTDWVREQARRVPGFMVGERFVLANFSYAKLPMVRDLENATEELVAHDLIAAIAGDSTARQTVQSAGPSPDAVPSPEPPPADEFLVLDADSTQIHAINAVVAGQHLIVRGPPGTGKSQSIANLVGTLIARGKSVLFVAEKRAAIDAVLKRLYGAELSNLVLDLHQVGTRKAFAQEIGRALYASRQTPRVESSAEERRLEQRRAALNENARALHEKREPWDVSFYEVLAELVGRQGQQYRTKFAPPTLERLHGDVLSEALANLDGYEQLGGIGIGTSTAPWARSPIADREHATEAFALLEELRREDIPDLVEALDEAADETQIAAPEDFGQAQRALEAWERAAQVASVFDASVYELPLSELVEATREAVANPLRRLAASLFSTQYRSSRQALRDRATRSSSDAQLHEQARYALATAQSWTAIGNGLPLAPRALTQVAERLHRTAQKLQRLQSMVGRTVADDSWETILGDLDRLYEDRETLAKLPEIRRLRAELEAAGLRHLLQELVDRPEGGARTALETVWLTSLFDHLVLADPALTRIGGDGLDRAVAEFQLLDREHLRTTSDRIRRIAAERATASRDEHPDQAQLVHRQAALQRKHMPVRSLVHAAADVLLALKPCWAMSPLMVSQLLPARPMFDVVVFDEASQVTPADAATSILRGRQLVVAGDERQLPPTRFFASDGDTDVDEDESVEDESTRELAGTQGFESILDALSGLFPVRMLQWHYRSRDERLIAFSNAYLYDRLLTTFPGVGGAETLAHLEVPWQPGSDTNSPSAEVDAVVDLILRHARERPTESLGVIAMGIKHALRVDEALRARLRSHPELDTFFDEDRDEPFFVKNLERVQGDERDAIILTIGYGKNSRGEMVYRFGPLLTEGGERRLNVAVTRAKRRLTLVTSFSAADLDPERLTSRGMQLLRNYVVFVASQGANLGERTPAAPQLNPFEVDVRDTLTKYGLQLVPQHGVSGYRIDFAVRHPERPHEFVLAIECDGATYHASETARDRDRLRQQQLETLGWRFHRIWSNEWFHRKGEAVAKVLAAYEAAVRGDPVPALAEIVDVDEAESAEGEPDGAPGTRGPRPNVPRGRKIDEYWGHQLIHIVDWIESDDLLRTEDEVISEAMAELGFQRRGARIVAVLRSAVQQARAQRKPQPTAIRKRTNASRMRSIPAGSSAAPTVEGRSAIEAPLSSPKLPPPGLPAIHGSDEAGLSGPATAPPSDTPLPVEGSLEAAPSVEETEDVPGSAWGPQHEQELVRVNEERQALEMLRNRLPPGEYFERLHKLLARRRELADARRRATARVADGSVVTLEDPKGDRVTTKISSSLVIRATSDGWIEPGNIWREGISSHSDLGHAFIGRKVGESVSVDGVDYRIVDINDR
ncbi:MAG TPA: AAA domain-containing protein [Candidatus Limnocylindria bacterium]|nr:AAA domain-containing protein [Candidatus Limnocylindria bacterium]